MRTIILCCLLCIVKALPAQDILNQYIRQGLENNLALKQKEAGLRKSMEALKEAKGLFYPNLAVNARYTYSQGGRSIAFPIGDLMNPVYSALNGLLSTNEFQMVENQEFQFLRTTEHETKLRLVQPVLNTDIVYNAKIKQGYTVAEEISLESYKRELTAEIKKAYYTVGLTNRVMVMLRETRSILEENVRVNEKLVQNDKVTADNLMRSRTELSKFDQEFLEAEKNRKVAVAYFNFLLNRSLEDSIILETPEDLMGQPADTGINYLQYAIENREEIKSLENYLDISELNIKLNRSAALPNIMMVADYGFQGERYEFNKNQDFLQASLVLSWDIFTGFQRKAKTGQALIQKEIIDDQLNEARKQVTLQVITAQNELKASEAGILTARDRLKTAREGFRLVSRKYEEGQASLIEFLDARNSMTNAEENLIISYYTHLINYAEFEKVTANLLL